MTIKISTLLLYATVSLLLTAVENNNNIKRWNQNSHGISYPDNYQRVKRSGGGMNSESVKQKSNELVKQIISSGYKAHYIIKNIPDRVGTRLLRELTTYNKALKEFIQLIKDDNNVTRPDVEKFLNRPHPNVAETDHKEWDARTRFNWAEEDYQQFQELMYQAREHWIELIHLHTYY